MASNSSGFNPITPAFQKVDKASADASVARFFYANGLPFNAACSSQYSDMVDQITKMPPGYKPPTYNRIRDELLDHLYISFVLYAVLGPNTLKIDKFEFNVFLATALQLFCQYSKILRITYCVLRITYE